MTSAHVPQGPGATQGASSSAPRRRMSGKTITALVLLALSFAFIFSNLNPAVVMFLGFRFVMPVWIWFLGVLLVGVVIGSLLPWFRGKGAKK